jgi:nitric oxide reductase NorE protein
MSERMPEFLWDDEESDSRSVVAERGVPRPQTPGLPAETGLWLFVLGDMTVFGWFFLVFMWERRRDEGLFVRSSAALYQPIGVVNTLVLLVSSLLVVLALHAHRVGRRPSAIRYLGGAGLCAVTFAGLKAVEYTLEIQAGHTPTENTFFLFYFALTGIHLVHVLVGALLLGGWWRVARRDNSWSRDRLFVESAAVYWHMVDLLWIVIFTLVYLVGAE